MGKTKHKPKAPLSMKEENVSNGTHNIAELTTRVDSSCTFCGSRNRLSTGITIAGSVMCCGICKRSYEIR